jgi:hypothetical protein
MSLTQEENRAPVLLDDPPCYEIHIRTWVTEENAAADLAAQISDKLDHIDQVDRFATTISLEDGSTEPARVYVELVGTEIGQRTHRRRRSRGVRSAPNGEKSSVLSSRAACGHAPARSRFI